MRAATGRDRVAVRVRGLSVRYGGAAGLSVLEDVSFAVAAGEFISIVGPSGCGKSTLLRTIGGLLAPASGEVEILGESAGTAQRRKRLGMVFQEPALLPWRRVAENVRLPLQVNRAPVRPSTRSVDDLLRLVGLDAFGHYRPHELSGGMQQRVALARALVFDPDVLLMDEPFGALDEITREQMRYELLRIWDAGGGEAGRTRKTVVFVTHSVAEAVALSDRVIVLSPRPGRITATLPITLPQPRQQSDERSGAFLDLVDEIRGYLGREPGA